MKRLVFSALFIISSAQSVFAVVPGAPSPEFALHSLDQKSTKLSEYRGKVILLDFWASWCGPCKESLPWLQSMQEKYGQRGFQVIAVNVDQNSDDAKSMLKELGVSLLTLLDPAGVTPEMYDLQSMPSSFLIDREGKIRIVHSGFSRSDREPLEHAIVSLL
ncbi:MAG: TlpA family protein disulfide reductase [Deltaproteobacteria bacterium]|nr:TlpA family protein disulfide reductase [Deltaproteobacteria bacterium]